MSYQTAIPELGLSVSLQTRKSPPKWVYIECYYLFTAMIIFGVCGLIMAVVSLFTEKIPRDELGGLTWSTINEPPISHGALGEEDDAEKTENGHVKRDSIELLKNGKTTVKVVKIIHLEIQIRFITLRCVLYL